MNNNEELEKLPPGQYRRCEQTRRKIKNDKYIAKCFLDSFKRTDLTSFYNYLREDQQKFIEENKKQGLTEEQLQFIVENVN